ncbi:hypothetical protein Pfo_005862 [Paulownia fortunei]|nr:hypothetical protein Pfo_005862 [Paulownia fortunei]
MAKRFQKHPSQYEGDQAGCIWGLISIFDFRHGRSTRRLLADRRRASKQVVGPGHSSTQTILPHLAETCENVVGVDEHKTPMADVAKTSVKELMEEEMFNEQGSKNQSNCSDMDLEKFDSKYRNIMEKNQKMKNRSCRKSRDMDVSDLDAAKYLMPEKFYEVPEQKPSDDLDLEIIMQELAQINQGSTECMKHDFHGSLDMPSAQTITVDEKDIVAAVDLFIEQRLSNSKHVGEEGKSCCSKEFMDALQTLSSNKGLFLKLLQDRNSLLVKHIENLEDARLGKDRTCSSFPAYNLSEENPKDLKSDKFRNHRHRYFFRRRSKSLDSFPVGGDEGCQSSSNIVILKPGPAGSQSPEADVDVCNISLQSHYKMENKVHNERNVSQFSFSEIKKKLRQAMGKQRQGISPDGRILKFSSKHQNGNSGDQSTTGENVGWSSPNRNHFYTERFAKSSTSFMRGELVGKSKDSGAEMVNQTYQYAKLGVSNIYIEAKKHLSEMLHNGDEHAESMNRQLPKSLGRILSLPDYSGSPCCSPREHSDDIFTTTLIRLSPHGSVNNNVNGFLQENHSNHPSPSRQTMECQTCVSGSNPDDEVQCLNMNVSIPFKSYKEYSSEIQSFTEDTVIPEVTVSISSSRVVEIHEMTGLRSQEEEKTTYICYKSSSNLITGDTQNGDTREVNNEESSSQCLKDSSLCFKSDLFGEVQLLSSPPVSPTRSPVSREVEDTECAIDRMERPSPVSVLEPLYTDDDISPASTITQPVEKELQPQHINFEEQSSASDQGICMRISLEDEESAFEYVEAVLLGSGLNWDEFLLRWLSWYEVLDPSLFDEVELFSGRPRHDQKLLFDCANEILKEVCESHFGSFTGILHGKQNIRPVLIGMDLIHEVWQRVEWHLFQHLLLHSLEQLVKRDMARSGKWMDLQSDIELISFEIGETIFDELVQDTLLSFIDGTSEYKFEVLQAESDAIEDMDL